MGDLVDIRTEGHRGNTGDYILQVWIRDWTQEWRSMCKGMKVIWKTEVSGGTELWLNEDKRSNVNEMIGSVEGMKGQEGAQGNKL